MQSEFFTFSQNLKTLLKKDSAQRAENTAPNRQQTERIKNDIADFFDLIQQKIHVIESPALKEKKIRQVQKLTTDLSDRLYRRRVSKQILLKLFTRLQSLREKHPAEFNHNYPVPKYIFIITQMKRKKQVEEIVRHLNSLKLDLYLIETLTDYFEFRDHPTRVSSPSWKNLDYHDLLSKKILKVLKNSTVENLDRGLLRFFIRYNFNLNCINDYYICKIDSCLDERKKKEKALFNQLINILQTKPLKNIAYNENFKSIHRDLNDHIKIKLNELEGNGSAVHSLYFPQYNKNTKVMMLFEELQMDIGYRNTPLLWKNFYQYMSEYTRGMGSVKLSPKSYENGWNEKDIKTYDEVDRMLKEMTIKNEEKKAFYLEKLGRSSKNTK